MAGGQRALRDAARYAGLAIGLSWASGLPAVLGARGNWLPKPLVGLGLAGYIAGPAAAALILAGRDEGRAGVRRLVKRFSRASFPARWWLALPVAASAAAITASTPLRHARLPGPGITATTAALAAAPAVFTAAALEQVGWRGHLLPRLQRHVSPATASVLIGVPWGLWHLPLLLLPGPNSDVPLWTYPAGALTGSFVYTALFNATGGSLIIVTGVHGLRNVASGIFLRQQDPAIDPTPAYAADLAFMLAAAVALFIATRQHNTRRPPTPALPQLQRESLGHALGASPTDHAVKGPLPSHGNGKHARRGRVRPRRLPTEGDGDGPPA